MDDEVLHFGPNEIAEKLDVSVSTVWRLIRSGQLRSVMASPKPGLMLRKRVLAADLDAFVKARSHVA